MLVDNLVFETPFLSQTTQLNQQTFPQVAGSHADRMKRLDEVEHFLQLFQRVSGVVRNVFQRSLEKTEIVDVADDQFGCFPLQFGHVGGVQLLPEMLLQSFLAGNRVKEKLSSFFVLKISGRVADILSHVIPPFLIQLCQPLELFLEFAVVLGSFLGLERVDFFFQDRIGLQLLLNDIPAVPARGPARSADSAAAEAQAPAALIDFGTDGSPGRPYGKLLSRRTVTLEEQRANFKEAE